MPVLTPADGLKSRQADSRCMAVGPFPQDFCISGSKSSQYFFEDGTLLRVDLHPWLLEERLTQKYKMPPAKAASFASFLLCMLQAEPAKRASASELLKHPWLDEEEDDDLVLHYPRAEPIKTYDELWAEKQARNAELRRLGLPEEPDSRRPDEEDEEDEAQLHAPCEIIENEWPPAKESSEQNCHRRKIVCTC